MSHENPSPEDQALYRQASRRYAIKQGLRVHALVYGLVNAGLIGLNLLTAPGQLWFVYPLFGWGIGLLAHALVTWRTLAGDREQGIEAEIRTLKARRDAR